MIDLREVDENKIIKNLELIEAKYPELIDIFYTLLNDIYVCYFVEDFRKDYSDGELIAINTYAIGLLDRLFLNELGNPVIEYMYVIYYAVYINDRDKYNEIINIKY